MSIRRLRQARRLFNTGDKRLDRRNQRAWVQAIRVVRSTKKGWMLDLKDCTKEIPECIT